MQRSLSVQLGNGAEAKVSVRRPLCANRSMLSGPTASGHPRKELGIRVAGGRSAHLCRAPTLLEVLEIEAWKELTEPADGRRLQARNLIDITDHSTERGSCLTD